MAKKQIEAQESYNVNMLLIKPFHLFYRLFKQTNAGKIEVRVTKGDKTSIFEITLKERPAHKDETDGLSLDLYAKKGQYLNLQKIKEADE